MRRTTQLAILYGLKKLPEGEEIPPMGPDCRIFGTFQDHATAVEYVSMGGLSAEFPYYGVALERGGFWVVASSELSEDEMGRHNPRLRPTILDGPFDNPGEALESLVRTDKSGWRSVTVQCTSEKNIKQFQTGERRVLESPDLEWLRNRVPRWEKMGSSLGEAATAASETKAMMNLLSDWFQKNPDSDIISEELLDLSVRMRRVHEKAHERISLGGRVARAREGRN